MVTSLPIKNIEEINQIKDLYRQKNQIRDLLLFELAINTGLDLVDLLNLKVEDVKDKYCLTNGKQKTIPFTSEIQELIPQVIGNKNPSEYLFSNRYGKKLTRISVFYVFKNNCAELGLSEKYSVASWRKTFAYHHYEKYKDLSYLMWLFNQHNANLALKFIDVEESMNLRFREGVCL